MEPSQIPVGDRTLLGQWKLGDQQAASELYERYADKLFSLAQRNISKRFASRFDADDIVQSVMRTFFCRAADGRLSIAGHSDIWKLLVSIALCKTRNRTKFHDADKRSTQQTIVSTEAFEFLGEPSEQEAVDLADLLENVVRSLDPKVSHALQLMLVGKSQDEIATELAVTTRSVRRYHEQISERLSRVLEE